MAALRLTLPPLFFELQLSRHFAAMALYFSDAAWLFSFQPLFRRFEIIFAISVSYYDTREKIGLAIFADTGAAAAIS